MGKKKEPTPVSSEPRKKMQSMEAQEAHLIALAYDLVEQRMLDGTATSQETVHFLRLGSSKERLERKMMENQINLLQEKVEQLQSARRIESLYADAVKAVASYSSPSTMMSAMAIDNDDKILP